jgi:uncharacterized protein YndB with AHSA1/START domain
MSDAVHDFDAVERAVGSRRAGGEERRTVTIARTYDGTAEEVWAACTDPERIPRWFLPVSGELRLGGRYQLEGNAGGTIERCEPPRLLVATWEYGATVSWTELRLSAVAARSTRLELTHITAVDDGGHWQQFGPGASGVGWDLALMGLGRHLRSGAAVDPAEARAWSASAEGREFMSLSSQRWGKAAIGAGEAPDEARAAAARTSGFYLGELE